jgi:hypothetical protein
MISVINNGCTRYSDRSNISFMFRFYSTKIDAPSHKHHKTPEELLTKNSKKLPLLSCNLGIKTVQSGDSQETDFLVDRFFESLKKSEI